MSKRNKIKMKTKKKRGARYHIIHKSKLSLLLIMKIILAFFSFLVISALFAFLSPWSNLEITSFLQFVYWAFAMALILFLYLYLIIHFLKLLKFK